MKPVVRLVTSSVGLILGLGLAYVLGKWTGGIRFTNLSTTRMWITHYSLFSILMLVVGTAGGAVVGKHFGDWIAED
jgi:hypothetical protein